MASENPSVEKLILVNTSAYPTEKERRMFNRFRDISLWNEEKRNAFEILYGKDGLSKNYNNFVNEINLLRYLVPPNVLKGINCPTVILHSEHDVFVDSQHAVWLQKRIKNSKVWLYRTDHTILKDKYAEVNRRIHEFLFNQINQSVKEYEKPDDMYMYMA